MAEQPVPVNPLPKARQEFYQQRMNKESQNAKDIQKKVAKFQSKQQQLMLQKQENEMVENELGIMEEEAVVYKLVGPVLVSQEVDDAKNIISKRLEYINTEIKQLETNLANANKDYETAKKAINKVQEDFRAEIEQMLKPKQ